MKDTDALKLLVAGFVLPKLLEFYRDLDVNEGSPQSDAFDIAEEFVQEAERRGIKLDNE